MKEYYHVLYRCGRSDKRLVWFRDNNELESKLKHWKKKHLCDSCFQETITSRKRREVEELMGKYMTTSKRVGGRVRSVNRK